MQKNNWYVGLIIVLLGVGLFLYESSKPGDPIKIGLVVELTGDVPAVGASSKQGAELFVKQVNEKGGVRVGLKKHPLELVVKDNGGSVDQTKAVTEALIKQDNVVAIVGPNASRYAIPAAEVAEANKVTLVSPWSTNPQTTLSSDGQPKHYVFRAAFTDPFQGRVLANFVRDSLKAQKTATLYDETADVLKGQADNFKTTYESNGGTVVSTQTFKAGDKDFSAQLQAIKSANPDIIFLPAYYADAAAIVKAAKAMGIATPFVGSDAWGSQEILQACGAECNGFYLSGHYSPSSDAMKTQVFVADYKSAYNNATPDDVAALTYDAFGLVSEALSPDRETLRNAFARINDYQGVTGTMTFADDSGDPVKSAVIQQIKDGQIVWFAEARP